MYLTYVTRKFLDYRVPVFAALDELIGGHLCVVFSQDCVPKRVSSKLTAVLGTRAIGLSGEWQLGHQDTALAANSTVALQYHPGLLRTIRRCKPDVVIGDGFFKWTLPSIFYKVMHGTPLVICYERTFHTERNAQWYRIAFRRLVVRLTDAVCCSGTLCGEYTRSLGFPADRITYGHQAADVEGLQHAISTVSESEISRTVSDYDIKGVVFVYVGQLIPRKGVRELLNAWRLFMSRLALEQLTLLLVGDGPLRVELQQYCEEHGLNNVRFTGSVDYDSIGAFYKVANILVMPTLEDNWSLVVPEAMACGLPVLCSKYNGCWPELVHPEINGWVFDPLDSNDFADKLRLCMGAQDRLGQLGKCSREIVERFTPESAAKSILTTCEIAIARSQH